MIKRQYHRFPPPGTRCYFHNFIKSHDPESIIEDELKKYKATIGKSKNTYAIMNVKWHCEQSYTLFVLRYA